MVSQGCRVARHGNTFLHLQDLTHQRFRREGLVQENGIPANPGILKSRRLRVARHENHGKAVSLAAKLLDHFRSAHARHHDVCDHNVDVTRDGCPSEVTTENMARAKYRLAAVRRFDWMV